MEQNVKYLSYLTQAGVTVLVSYEDIQSITKGPEVRVEGSNERYFLVLIIFVNGVQEQQAVSEYQLNLWQEGK